MELIFVITSLCIALSVLLKPSQCLQTMQPQASNDQPGLEQRHIIPALPRKLMLTEVKYYEVQDMGSYNTRKDHALSARMSQHKEAKMRNTNEGTWRERMERGDPSQFFTMDYSHVRRRRPIHNKSLPVAP